MKILHINKFHFLAGGIERYLFDLATMQRAAGHEVLHFAMAHPENVPCGQSDYFPETIAFREVSTAYKVKMLPRIAGRSIYSFDVRKRLAAMLEAERPDIAHVHLVTHQLSPSVLDALRAANIPTVMTLHEHSLACPSGRRYVPSRNEPCDRCLGGSALNAIRHRCVQDRALPSALAAAAFVSHRGLRIYTRSIDLFLSPSKPTDETLAAANIPPEQIRRVPHGIDLTGYEPQRSPGRYFLSFGRLSPEKGVADLLAAAALVPELDIRIAGSGPDESRLRAMAETHRLRNLTFLGFLESEALREAIREARAVVVPSNCYETGPLSCLEAFALGKPVIGTRIGGIPELVGDDERGLLVPPQDPEALSRVMLELNEDDARCVSLGEAGVAFAVDRCMEHSELLDEAYGEALALHAD